MKKFISIVMVIALVSALFAVTTSAESEAPTDYIAYFSFDDTESGLSGGGAVATAYTLDDEGNEVETTAVINTEVASQDDDDYAGTAGCLELLADSEDYDTYWLKVTKEDGTPLLTGVETLSISFWANTDASTDASWAFFAVPEDETTGEPLVQSYQYEEYLGVLLNAGITVERYNNDGARVSNISSGMVYGDEWQHIVVVVDESKLVLYQDGEWWTEVDLSDIENDLTLSTILGEASTLFIGTSTWTSVGTETFHGYLDEFYIYDYALSEDQVAALYAANAVEAEETEPETTAADETDEATETEEQTSADASESTEAEATDANTTDANTEDTSAGS